MTERADDPTDPTTSDRATTEPGAPLASGGDTSVAETTGLAGRGTGETAGYVGGLAEGVPGSAGARQMQQDDAADDEPDANLAQADH